MTTDTPLTRYSATNGALASGFITAELHHLMGHDRTVLTSIFAAIAEDAVALFVRPRIAPLKTVPLAD
ncbi:hypothetical protein [Mesorhizobium sp. 113-3-3]|uniref:hypothetical protein n=1 Tax=Mesorhizobium sp. 113-3-3 TaxID=2744516 RepID=UPI0018EB9697|nr:hypothetical protein [Mesorhizobium sp. 113-3-3]BCG83302.1 hypothetical protein MesoLj113b_68440 [Mesorhizobium sp. 113-3-3]